MRRPAAIRALVRRRQIRFTSGNRIELFDNGRDGLAAMLAAIRGATRQIHLETYILRADSTGSEFVEALSEKAAAGLDVSLIYDALGSRGLDRDFLSGFVGAGGRVVRFNPFRRWFPTFTPRRRDHRKLLIIDGRVGFVGGLNIGDEYAATVDGVPSWRDEHLRLEGPAVRDLEALFLESWFRAGGPGLPWQDLLSKEPEPVGDTRCAVLADGPLFRRRRMRDVLISGLADAENRVLLVSPYFSPGRRVLDALEQASERGIRVDLLLAGRTDHPLFRRATRAILPRLLARGVRVFEDHNRMMHAKVAVFDDSVSIVGTSNLDRQSFEYSFEVNVILEGPGFPERVRQRFVRDLEHATPISAESLAHRGPLTKLVDGVAALGLWMF